MDMLMILLGIVVFMLVLFSGLFVVFGLGFLVILLLSVYVGLDIVIDIVVDKVYLVIDFDILVVILLFILVVQFIFVIGMGKWLFSVVEVFLWWLCGGLGVVIVGSSGVFFVMMGLSFVLLLIMGLIVILELCKVGYGEFKIVVVIMVGGILGSMILFSIVMIVYGYFIDELISKLFMVGVIFGLLLILLYLLFMVFIGYVEYVLLV